MRSWRERVAGKQERHNDEDEDADADADEEDSQKLRLGQRGSRLFTAGWFECSRLVFFLHLVRAMEGPRSSNSSPSRSRLRPPVVDPLEQAGFVSKGDTV